MHPDLTERLLAAVKTHCLAFDAIGVAVSGGGDSIALLHLLALAELPGVHVATVDHQLRQASAVEAESVARTARELGMPHETLVWTGWDGTGNLQDAARSARQLLLRNWARRHGLRAVALGHTQEDQAETVMMRLARGSGVDGLAGMAVRRSEPEGLTWLRPLLSVSREDLRDWLRTQGIRWIDDPSNEDRRFDRVRARQLLHHSRDLGISVAGVAETAERMAAAVEVLNAQALAASQRLVHIKAGAIWIDEGLWHLPDDTRWRLLAAAHCQVSRNVYRPRISALQQSEHAARHGRAHTLHGCLMVPDGGGVRIQPELKALTNQVRSVPGLWAGWRIEGPASAGAECRALGQLGLRSVDNWRNLGVPYELAQTLPGIWQGEALAGAPHFGAGPWSAVPVWGRDEFNTLFISH